MRPEEINARLSNIVVTAQAMKSRANLLLSTQELEQIGLLTMRMRELEELISFLGECLLMRPELSGFHSHRKALLSKQISEKTTVLNGLTIASGILYGISTERLEKSFAAVKDVAEERNAVIHGTVEKDAAGNVVFQSHGRKIPSSLAALRDLTQRGERVAFQLAGNFSAFYEELVSRKPNHCGVSILSQARLK